MIRPVEMQMILPQANQVGMQQHTENQHAALLNAQGTTELSKEVQQHSEMVIHKEDPDLMEYRYDAKERGNNTYDDFYAKKRKKRRASGEEAEEQSQKKPAEGWVNFDIKV